MTTAMNETKENFMVDDYRMCVWLTKLNYGFDCHDGGYAKDGYATRCTYCIICYEGRKTLLTQRNLFWPGSKVVFLTLLTQ